MTNNITTINQLEDATKSGVVIVDFFAPWCAPCMALKPRLEELQNDGEFKAGITYINVDDAPEVAQKFSIRSIPTLILFKDGKQIDQKSNVSDEEIRQWVKDNL
ncbi:MAG: thioredoxin family protein [Alphaproteobacteria bacterium]|nr:thioredoxin family protein [Alphaproteobacteria bacterium]MBL0717706.1 thioredoxin family protein [Alphaproteobacteria bacterium]